MKEILLIKERHCGCGGEKVCYSSNVGGVDNEDEYVVYCPRCGVVHQRIWISGDSLCADSRQTECPFCGRSGDEHLPIPFYLVGYVTRYLPLFKFRIGKTKAWIVLYSDPLEEGAIVLDYPWVFSQKKLKLNLPVPYDHTELGAVSEIYDEVNVNFRLFEGSNKNAKIEVIIRKRKGYWYYTSLDDGKPAVETTRREIVITANGRNHLSVAV